jgi:hypothetical protein
VNYLDNIVVDEAAAVDFATFLKAFKRKQENLLT